MSNHACNFEELRGRLGRFVGWWVGCYSGCLDGRSVDYLVGRGRT